MPTIGETLVALRERSGLTLEDVARNADYRGRSSVQKFFTAEYDPEFLDVSVARRLAKAMVGHGRPPIDADEIMDLAANEPGASRKVGADVKSNIIRDVAIYLASERMPYMPELGIPEEVPLVLIELDTPVAYAWHPPALIEQKAFYGLLLTGPDFEPRYRTGEHVIIDNFHPAKLGDDVCLYLTDDETSKDGVIVVTLATVERRTSSEIYLRSLDGVRSFSLPSRPSYKMHRLVSAGEALVGR
jgi:hypothetical protein